jgi:hypothetical protein
LTRREFAERFHRALEEAAQLAAGEVGHAIPRTFLVELHGAGYSRVEMTPEAAVEALYLGGTLFYRIIDIAVIAVSASTSTVFVRASGHEPSTWDRTWNDPPGSGPFKQLVAARIRLTDNE